MNPRELVDHIHSGPAELVLDEALRFRRRTRSNPCDFNEFLQALQSSETIRTVECKGHQVLGITEDEWVLLVKALGRIRDIRFLNLCCESDSRDFDPFQTIAEAVNSARSLYKLRVSQQSQTFPRDPSGLLALANTLREHATLEEFTWLDWCPLLAPRDLSLDPVLRALPACPHLRKVLIMTQYASSEAMKCLLQLRPVTELRILMATEHWLAVAEEIRQGRCNVQKLSLYSMHTNSRSEATEAVQAVVSAIRRDCNLKHLTLESFHSFTNEESVALAEALTVNTTLRMINFSQATLSAPGYEALSAMLRVNTSLVLQLPLFETDGADTKLLESRNQMVIEARLNRVGRGRLLASRQTRREEYVDALHELDSYNVDDSPAFQVSCLYSLLRLCPAVCMS
jgi:hypothetical protein